jgi:hypothetical protein
MAVELRSASGAVFQFTTRGWAFYLTLAQAYGWNGQGTRAPEHWNSSEAWPGAYDWNAGQTVVAPDAMALADALSNYLTDPRRSPRARLLADRLRAESNLHIDLSEDDRAFVSSFIAFAKQGAFEIH